MGRAGSAEPSPRPRLRDPHEPLPIHLVSQDSAIPAIADLPCGKARTTRRVSGPVLSCKDVHEAWGWRGHTLVHKEM